LDVATDRQPVLNYQRLRSQIAAALPEMLSPQHPGITVESVADDHDTSAGYVIIDVPTSDQRPHMSLKEHRYFRRGSDGTRVLEHAEVRELMFAVREGVLELEHIARTNGSTGDLTFQVSVVIVLRNTGRVPAVAPYVRATGEGWTMSWSMQGLGRRSSSRGGLTGIYSSRDVLVHPDDEIEIAEIETGLDFRQTGQIDIRHAIAVVEDNPASLLMVPFSKMNPQGYAIVDEPIACSGTFGAENSPAKPFEFRIDKMKLFALFREQHKL
jgi:hypothetical protein